MAKNIFHDIVPPEKRSIRNIKINTVRTDKRSTDDIKRDGPVVFTERAVPQAPKKGVWFVALCCFLGLIFSVLYLVSTADISLVLKKFVFEMNDTVVASKRGDGLTYSSVTLSDSLTSELAGSSLKEVSTKASGTVIVYNNQSTSQTLIVGTRIQDNEGLIFTIDKKIVVPARKTVSGSAVPGNIEVAVRAEKAGDKYNVGLADFTIPAFKGNPKFNTVYARSKKEIVGGNLGMVPIVSDTDIVTAKKEIKDKLIEKNIGSARAQIPATSILLDGMYTIVLEDVPQIIKGDKLIIGTKITFTGYIFDKNNLVLYLSNLKKITVSLDDPVDLKTEKMTYLSIKEDNNSLSFKAKGNINVSYILDETKLKNDFKGKSKSEVINLLKNQKSIESAGIKTFPLWLIPRNTDRIKLNIN